MSRRKSTDDDRWFEQATMAELARLPTSAWPRMVALSRGWDNLRPTTRRRLLVRCLELACERGDAQMFLLRFGGLAAIVRELTGDKSARVHDEKQLREAARYLVANPTTASIQAIAAHIGAPKPTVAQWFRRADFAAECREALARLKQGEFRRLKRRLRLWAWQSWPQRKKLRRMP
jgi:hypothetical protein